MIRRLAPFLLVACTDAGSVTLDDTDTSSEVPPGSDIEVPAAEDPWDGEPEPVDVAVTQVILEVDHEPDAKPYVGTDGLLSSDPWDLFDINVRALYEGSDIDVSFPTKLNQMGTLPDLDEAGFTVSRILELSREHRDTPPVDGTAIVHVLWLNGRFATAEGIQDSVIGVSIGSTGVIAMFKPVIRTLGNNDRTRGYGEQATLVHEFGHAVGLVNRALPMSVDHQDTEHGKHCTNRACIMYWAIEGASGLGDFIGLNILNGEEVLFDRNCLDDVAAGLGVNR